MNEKYSLYLDDIRQPEDTYSYTHNQLYLMGWNVVRIYDQFIKIIKELGVPDMISLDHDLESIHYTMQDHLDQDYYNICEGKTGYHCAKWLINYCIDNKLELPATILIHSMNHAGSLNIKSLFTSYYKSIGLSSPAIGMYCG